jgi:SAM-dependent methyltransferase
LFDSLIRRTLIKSLLAMERRIRAGRLALMVAEYRKTRLSQTTRANSPGEWDIEYASQPLIPVKSLTNPIAGLVANLTKPGDTLLEAGCGSGILSAQLATTGRRIYLCDFSWNILLRARRLFEVSGLQIPEMCVCDLTSTLPYADCTVDTVWSSGVLEHWDDSEIKRIVADMRRVSRHSVIAFVPYAGSVLYRMGKYLAERNGLWPYGRELPRMSLYEIFTASGLREVQEQIVCPEYAPNTLGLAEPIIRDIVAEWWDNLPLNDPVRFNQGYLLMTVGYR